MGEGGVFFDCFTVRVLGILVRRGIMKVRNHDCLFFL